MNTPTPRHKPRCGDQRETRRHGKQIRVFDIIQTGPDKGCYNCTGGRQRYLWVSHDEAVRRGFAYLLQKTTVVLMQRSGIEGTP